MVENFRDLRQINVDPKIVEQIERSPKMLSEQGNFMGRWGGPSSYRAVARLPEEERLAYLAVKAGYVTPTDIEEVTGLGDKEVRSAVTSLGKKGFIGNYKEILQGAEVI